MKKSTGITYAQYKFKCQLPDACMDFESLWDAGECYEKGGRLVKKCAESKLMDENPRERQFDQEIDPIRDFV